MLLWKDVDDEQRKFEYEAAISIPFLLESSRAD